MTGHPGRFPSGKLRKKVTNLDNARPFTSYDFDLGMSHGFQRIPMDCYGVLIIGPMYSVAATTLSYHFRVGPAVFP